MLLEPNYFRLSLSLSEVFGNRNFVNFSEMGIAIADKKQERFLRVSFSQKQEIKKTLNDLR
jgi:hypothetical protein